ncbi:MAG: hypothetical protein ACKO7D_09930 [Bacteroidota bacterium]
MVKYLWIILLIIPIQFFSQEFPGLNPTKIEIQSYFGSGLIKASATIAPGRMIQNHANSINLSGFLEYVVDKNYSFRGDVIQFIDAGYSSNTLIEPTFQNRLFFGAFRHFGRTNLKFYAGLQMGTTITTYNQSFLTGNRTHVAPSFAMKSGVSYYVWKYFHFFADLTYVNSTLRGTSFGSHRMDELVFSAGLGFQINVKKSN